MLWGVSPAGLVERDRELDALEVILDQAAHGNGQAIVVEGPPGIGKSELLSAAVRRADERGFRVLSGSGAELERAFSFGVTRQLFEPVLSKLSLSERTSVFSGAAALAAPIVGMSTDADGAAGDIFPLLHGLYWLVAALAGAVPLLIAVDDAQWADEPTLRWLHYLIRRLDGLSVAVALTTRSTAPDAPVPLIEAVKEEPPTVVIHPNALSATGVSAVLADVFAEQPEPGFSRACQDTSGGNPFLLKELCRELESAGYRPLDTNIGRLPETKSRSITRHVISRLETLSHSARSLAEAVAVFGSDVDLQQAANVAGLHRPDAAVAADELMGAALLSSTTPVRYTHALVRAAVYAELPPSHRAELHARAARVLRNTGAPQERVAGHLLRAEPSGDQQTVEQLRQVAAAATARGSLSAACSYLRRAMAEPPTADTRAQVLLDLAGAEAAAADPQAGTSLPEAFAAATTAAMRATAFEHAAWFFLASGRTSETLAMLDTLQAEIHDDLSRELELEAQFVAAALLDPSAIGLAVDRLSTIGEELTGSTSGERMMLCHLAYHRMWRSEDARRCIELANRALGGGELLRDGGVQPHIITGPIMALTCADELDTAAQVIDEAKAIAVRRGSEHLFAFLSCMRAILAYRKGDLGEAEAEAQTSVDITLRSGLLLGAAVGGGWLIWTLVERGALEEARQVLDAVCPDGQVAPLAPFSILLAARGRLRIATGDLESGVEDLLECGRRNAVFDIRNPVFVPWRVEAVNGLRLLGRMDDARELAAENLAVATTWGTAGAIGGARRLSALLLDARSDADGELRLAEALVRRSPAKLELARTLLDLGRGLRRSNQRTQAREYLSECLDLATRCGAKVIAAEAGIELRATGARPRRPIMSGVESLTSTETRVAGLAVNGLTNSEIAQRLFVSQRTVENHLGRVYRKLDIRSRDELATHVIAS